jgi:hypothetical protein
MTSIKRGRVRANKRNIPSLTGMRPLAYHIGSSYVRGCLFKANVKHSGSRSPEQSHKRNTRDQTLMLRSIAFSNSCKTVSLLASRTSILLCAHMAPQAA